MSSSEPPQEEEEAGDASRLRLAWAKGGHAEILRLEGESIELRSTTSAPPGARLEAKTNDGRAVKIKSYGTHREADGTFTLKGRLLDATKQLRDKLALYARS